MILCDFPILDIWKIGAHFMLSGFVGSLVYWLMVTTLSNTSCFQKRIGVFSTSQFSLFVALCFAVLAHIVEDYTFGLF